MSSKILLISTNRCIVPDPVFPLGLAYLSAALRRAGHECLWLDSLADGKRFGRVLEQSHADFVGISLRNIDDVLIRKRQTFFDDVPSLVARIREVLNCPIILGGSGFSIFPERLLGLTGADFGIAGEGEADLVALIAALETRSDYQTIPGLVFRQDDKIVLNACTPRAAHCEIAEAERPTALSTYYLRNGAMLNVQTQRGCPFRCCYCTYPMVEGRQHRPRQPELIAEEFADLQRMGARYAFVVDSVFNSSPRHVTETCEALLRRGVKLAWGCFLRPQGLTRALMRLMARAGLTHIEFGSDSLCDDVLAAYHKGFDFEDILQSSELARQEKVDHCHFLIAGGPGETRATLARGFENSQRLGGAVIMAVVGMRIYPGTHLHAQALADGQIGVGTDLLTPAYYLAPGLMAEEVFAQLQDFSRRSPDWLVGDPNPAFDSLVARLRHRGVVGPLWSYFAMLQRLQPRELAGVSPTR